MQTLLENNSDNKKEVVLDLLKQNVPYSDIQSILKKNFGSGMSNRDIKKIRENMDKIPATMDNYQKAFVLFYELALSLKDHISDSDSIDEINQYHDLFYDTRKTLILQDLPDYLKNKSVIDSISESLDEYKEGNFLTLDEIKKKRKNKN